MRRKDRQVSSPEGMRAIISRCPYCHMSLCDGEIPYGVPMNFGYRFHSTDLELSGPAARNDRPVATFYFHCAKDGRKLDIIRKSPGVWLTFVGRQSVEVADPPCRSTARYESVMCSGTARILDDPDEASQGLEAIMLSYMEKARPAVGKEQQHPVPMAFDPKALERTVVVAVDVFEITAKSSFDE